MTLEVRFNKAKHTHENKQFRRIAKVLVQLFEKEGWDGLLMGNVENEEFERYRADGFLFYNGGLLLFDLKDYSGRIEIPRESEFAECAWFNINNKGEKLKVKGGSRFINPFRQINSYRTALINLIELHPILKNEITSNQIGVINIFTGPIELNREVGGTFNRYYNIVEESSLPSFLFDYSSKNSFNNKCSEIFKDIFPSEEYLLDYSFENNELENDETRIIDGKIKSQVESFLSSSDEKVLILKSSSFEERDNWAELIPDIATNNGAPSSHVWIHSARLKSRVEERSGVLTNSLYGSIFGGKNEVEQEETVEDIAQETVPLKSDIEYSEKDVFIIHEAHLVSKGLFQSNFLKFGTGRLLNDLLSFIKLKDTKRKLICIGDPYSISYGKIEDNALQLENYENLLVKDLNSKTIRENPFIDTVSDLISSIEEKSFVNLNYPRSEELDEIDSAGIANTLKSWFSIPLSSPPKNGYLLYSRTERLKFNKWIKENCLKNGEYLAEGDLLIAQNNIRLLDDEKNMKKPSVSNGEYLVVNAIKGDLIKSIKIKANEPPVLLKFNLIEVTRLGSKSETFTLYALNNFIEGREQLSEKEELALIILQQQIIKAIKKDFPFEKSEYFLNFKNSEEKNLLDSEIINFKERLDKGEKVKGKLEQAEINLRKLERSFKRKYNAFILSIANTDPIINTLHTTYGWVITVNRSLGTLFDNVILDCQHGANNGENEHYFRWIYSAFQAADKNVFLRNLIEFSPTSKLEEYDYSERSEERFNIEEQEINKTLLEFVIPAGFKDRLELETKLPNVQYASEVIHSLLNKKFEIIKIFTTEYAVKIKCQHNFDTFTIVLDHKKSGIISKIRVEETKQSFKDLLSELWELLVSKSICTEKVIHDKSISLSGFRKVTYDEWKRKLADNNIKVEILQTNSAGWNDILRFSRNKIEADLKFFYKKKGYFSKNPIVLFCNDDKLLDEIQQEIF